MPSKTYGEMHGLAELSLKDAKRTQEHVLLSAEQLTRGVTSSGGIYNSDSLIHQFQGKSSQPCSLNLSFWATSPEAKPTG